MNRANQGRDKTGRHDKPPGDNQRKGRKTLQAAHGATSTVHSPTTGAPMRGGKFLPSAWATIR